MKISVHLKKIQRHRGKGKKLYGLSWGHIKDGKWSPSGKIEIEQRQREKTLLDTLIHEVNHANNPTFTETEVTRQSNILSGVLWKMGYRRG